MKRINRQPVKIGFAVLATEALDLKQARKNASESIKSIKKLRAEVVTTDDLIMSSEKAREVVEKFENENIDFLIIQIGTWCPDDMAIEIVKEIEVPFILWAVPEVLKGGFPDGGMLVGLTQTGGTLSKFGKKFKPLFGNPRDSRILEQIRRSLKVAETVKRLKQSKVGLVGCGCPGMSDTRFHELELRRTIGPEVVHIDLSQLALGIRAIPDKKARVFVRELKKVGKIIEPSEEDMVEASKIYLALRRIVDKNHLNGLAIKCWPELRQLGIMSPCFALSRLSDEGIMSACEGDLTGAVAMMMLNYLTDKPAGLCDFIDMDEKKNIMLGFHCGAAASSLAESKSKINLCLHAEAASEVSAWKKGVTVEFPIKPGRITFARLGEIKGEYRLLIMGGEALPTDMFVRGNPIKVKLDINVKDVLEKLIAEGSEHHQLYVHGDVKEDLLEACKLLGIKSIMI